MMPTFPAAPDWMKDAACRWAPDPDAYFPEPGPGNSSKRAAHDAITVCGLCTVRTKCLAYALENREEGVWGGLTDGERKEMRRAAR